MRTTKPSCSREWFHIDWTAQLQQNGVDTDTATIDTVTWTVDGVTSVTEVVLGMITYIKLAGGTKSLATAEAHIRVNANDVELCETIYIDIIG